MGFSGKIRYQVTLVQKSELTILSVCMLLLLMSLSGLVVSSSYAMWWKISSNSVFTIQSGVWEDWPICYHRSKHRRAAAAGSCVYVINTWSTSCFNTDVYERCEPGPACLSIFLDKVLDCLKQSLLRAKQIRKRSSVARFFGVYQHYYPIGKCH